MYGFHGSHRRIIADDLPVNRRRSGADGRPSPTAETYSPSAVVAAVRLRFGCFVIPVRDSDINSRANCVIRLSA
jgi:hypothetical protein